MARGTLYRPRRRSGRVVDLASTTESPEAVRDGFGGAYLTFFGTCGLFYPIPEPTLSVLAELGLSLT